MTTLDTLNKILTIIPDAMCSIHEESLDIDLSVEQSYILDNLYVLWNNKNSMSCPSQKDIDNLTNQQITDAVNSRLKTQRDLALQSNIAVKVGLQMAQTQDSSLTLTSFLDSLNV